MTSHILTSFSISLHYRHQSAGSTSIYDLARHQGYIDADYLDPDRFFEAPGILRMDHDRYHCFLWYEAGAELSRYAYFLMGSLAALAKETMMPASFTRLAPDSSSMGYENVAGLLVGEDLTRLLIRNHGENLSLSFLDPDGAAPEHRLSPYFNDIKIPRDMWLAASVEALDEYCVVAAECLGNTESGPLYELVNLWRRVRDLVA